MSDFRPHRFPSLPQPVRTAPHRAGAGGAGGATAWHQPQPDGYDQGRDAGYRDGLASGHDRGLAAGFEAGLRQGRDQGLAESRLLLETLAGPVDAMLGALQRLRTDYQQAQRKEVVELVAKVARRVIRAELELQPAQLLNLVDETLAAMPATRDEIVVYLNPRELERIRELDPKRADRWTLVADPHLQAGECRVKSGDHEADAGCQQRLAAVMEQVGNRLQDSAGASDGAQP